LHKKNRFNPSGYAQCSDERLESGTSGDTRVTVAAKLMQHCNAYAAIAQRPNPDADSIPCRNAAPKLSPIRRTARR